MVIHAFTFGPFEENTYVLTDDTKQCIIVDPGCYTPEEKRFLAGFIEKEKLQPVRLLNTHGHIDHILGNNMVAGKYGLLPEMHKLDLGIVKAAASYGELWGIRMEPSPEPQHFLDEGDEIIFGNSRLEILFTPGHSEGSITFYSPEEKFLLSGDVLFNGSIGRTDLPGGDYEVLMQTIREKLMILPDDIKVYSGHGPETTIGKERMSNPFLQDILMK